VVQVVQIRYWPKQEYIQRLDESADDLSIMFVGEPSDFPNFYTFVSGIRKHR